MQATDVQDVLALSATLDRFTSGEDAPADTIVALINWRDSTADVVVGLVEEPDAGTTGKPKAKRGKAVEVPDDTFEATPDPASDEPDF